MTIASAPPKMALATRSVMSRSVLGTGSAGSRATRRAPCSENSSSICSAGPFVTPGQPHGFFAGQRMTVHLQRQQQLAAVMAVVGDHVQQYRVCTQVRSCTCFAFRQRPGSFQRSSAPVLEVPPIVLQARFRYELVVLGDLIQPYSPAQVWRQPADPVLDGTGNLGKVPSYAHAATRCTRLKHVLVQVLQQILVHLVVRIPEVDNCL